MTDRRGKGLEEGDRGQGTRDVGQVLTLQSFDLPGRCTRGYLYPIIPKTNDNREQGPGKSCRD